MIISTSIFFILHRVPPAKTKGRQRDGLCGNVPLSSVGIALPIPRGLCEGDQLAQQVIGVSGLVAQLVDHARQAIHLVVQILLGISFGICFRRDIARKVIAEALARTVCISLFL